MYRAHHSLWLSTFIVIMGRGKISIDFLGKKIILQILNESHFLSDPLGLKPLRTPPILSISSPFSSQPTTTNPFAFQASTLCTFLLEKFCNLNSIDWQKLYLQPLFSKILLCEIWKSYLNNKRNLTDQNGKF